MREPPSLTGILSTIPWASLSPPIQETIRTLGPHLVKGSSIATTAKETGLSEEQVGKQLEALRQALLDHATRAELAPALRARVEEARGSTAVRAGGGTT